MGEAGAKFSERIRGAFVQHTYVNVYIYLNEPKDVSNVSVREHTSRVIRITCTFDTRQCEQTSGVIIIKHREQNVLNERAKSIRAKKVTKMRMFDKWHALVV